MYRLPRYVFENNLKWFYDKHASQVPGGPPVIGSTEKNPIRLDEFGIRKAEFVSLLQVLFPRCVLFFNLSF